MLLLLSRLTQARGLKRAQLDGRTSLQWSRLTQARGLKLVYLRHLCQLFAGRASRRRVD